MTWTRASLAAAAAAATLSVLAPGETPDGPPPADGAAVAAPPAAAASARQTARLPAAGPSAAGERKTGRPLGVRAAPSSGVTQTSGGEEAAVRAALENYLKAHATGRGEFHRRVFHRVADLYWMRDGQLQTRASEAYIAGAPGEPAEDEAHRERRIEMVDVTGDAAVAKIVLDYPAALITDYMSLLKVDGEWRIVNKIFHVEGRPGCARAVEAAVASALGHVDGGAAASVYEVMAGGPSPAYFLAVPLESWADVAEAHDLVRGLLREAAPAPRAAAAAGSGTGVDAPVRSAETEVWRYRADLSYFPGAD